MSPLQSLYKLCSFLHNNNNTLIPWQSSKSLCWNVTVTCPLADSVKFADFFTAAYYYRSWSVVLPIDARSASAVLPSFVCSSVCLSVTLMYRGHIGWTSSKLITRIISLGSSLLRAQHWRSSPRGTPLKFGWNRRGVVLSRKPAISLKRGTIGPMLLLTTNRKSHTRIWLVPKSTTLDDLEWPLRTLFQNTGVFRSPSRNFEWR